jgi:dephospho-CoA kinase
MLPGELTAARATSGRFSTQTIEQRLKSQIPIEQKIRGADHVIENSGSLSDLEKQVRALWGAWINDRKH